METIEILSSIFGVIMGVVFIYQSYKHLSFKSLMDKLVDKKISTKWHHVILWVMNILLRFQGLGIKREYIKTYRLHDRGKIAVFKDFCDKNDIEPTETICKKFLSYDSKEARDYYYSKRHIGMSSEEKKAPPVETLSESHTSMKEESTVYLSDKLPERYPQICENLTNILKKHNVNYTFVEGTRDIWCRDYMPIQTKSGKFIQFKYEPSYLRKDNGWDESRSDVEEVCRLNNIDAEPSNINLDGGNVLICGDRAIISDRVFSENQDWNRENLVSELKKQLECEEIIIIPAQNSDMTGHADGMVRFVDRNTILGNDLTTELKYWREGMQKVIEEKGLKYINVPFFEPKDRKNPLSAVGVYVNYLEVNNLIILPVFGRDEDEQVICIIKGVFPDRNIETIDYSDVAKEGGLLNCTTWVITK